LAALLALDCEMCETLPGLYELTRISIVDGKREVRASHSSAIQPIKPKRASVWKGRQSERPWLCNGLLQMNFDHSDNDSYDTCSSSTPVKEAFRA
jgi:hypothetical protein